MFLRSFIFRHVGQRIPPGPLGDRLDRFGVFGEFITDCYRCWWISTETKLKGWHRARLREIDSQFRWDESMTELIKARRAARENGIGPMDPSYPEFKIR